MINKNQKFKNNNFINIKNKKKGISLIVLVITIIIIIILAAAVILTLTDNNPINEANKAAFINDLNSFKAELEMYKTTQYATSQGDYIQGELYADEGSLTYNGTVDSEKSIYNIISSLKGIKKYAGKFAVVEGQLVYVSKENDQRGEIAESVGVKYEIAGAPKVLVIPPMGSLLVEPGTDLVYTLKIKSVDQMTVLDVASMANKIKVLANDGVELITQPEIIVVELLGNTNTLKQYSITVKTNSLQYDLYKIKSETGIAKNSENIESQEYTTVNSFEVIDKIPPEAPVITSTPDNVTNGNVSVTIDYKDADVKLYSLDSGLTWLNYTTAINLTENKIVSAKGIDKALNETTISSKDITNIEKILPQDSVINVVAIEDKINGTITLLDNESGIKINESKYLITTQSALYETDATVWNSATAFTTNPQNISVTQPNNDYYIQTLSVDNAGNKKVNVSEKVTVSKLVIVNAPELSPGMTAVKWNETTNVWDTVIDPIADKTWYDYGAKKWANVKTKDGSMWVWIPRYEYKIPIPHTDIEQTILVNFINGKGTTPTTDYIMHPAFTFGTDQLNGIWVAKFEASGTTSAIEIKENATPIGNVTVSNMFTACRNMENNNAKYGWTTTNLDTHLIKNVEWGAAAYLSSSTYGKTGKVEKNTSARRTGGESYFVNVGQSTTGNVYGIYDLNGGIEEYTASYVNNGSPIYVSNYGANVASSLLKYRDVYTMGTGDKSNTNYEAASTKKGDAVYETSSVSSAYGSWYKGYSLMPATGDIVYETTPAFLRGGYYGNADKYYNIFSFKAQNGQGSTLIGFRPIVVVGTGI